MNNNRRLALIYVCFFLSGAAGLIYEVVWARQLGLFLGITSYAHTAVIAAYMLGLAAGSWWFGRSADRLTQHLRLYAWLELGVGSYAAITPWLFTTLQVGYANLAGTVGVAGSSAHLARFGIGLAALLLPTFLMGGTLPLLVSGVTTRLPQLGVITGRLYGINTMGATAGAALTGFVLLPRLGIVHSIFCGVVINLAIAALILLFVPRQVAAPSLASQNPRPETGQDELPPLLAAQKFVLLAGFAAAGFSALLTQLAWIRSMVLAIGGSVYAFTITLTTFLAGIGLGSLVYSHYLSRRQTVRGRFTLATVLTFFIGLSILLGLLAIARLPEWFLRGFAAGLVDNFTLYQLFMFALCFSVMILPTLLMGALFPLLAVTWTGSLRGAGRGIGSAYAVNTAGTILGALLGGLVLLPWLGIQHSIMLAAVLYGAVGVGFWWCGGRPMPFVLAGAIILFTATAGLIPPWDKAMMTRGIYYRPHSYLESLQGNTLSAEVRVPQMEYYKEGMDGTVTVLTHEHERSLYINGKVDASSSGDLETQVGLGQLGALLQPHARNALVIGLGTGITVAALATHRSIEHITVLEISPEVVEASALFATENRQVLKDPRVKLVSADARNYVLASKSQWDLIISEPSNPWVSGVSNLFTEDFFRLAKQKLAPGGVMTQWFHIYGLSVADIKSVLSGFASNYRYVAIWNTQLGDLIMTGSDRLLELDMQRLQQALSDPLIGPDLNRAGYFSARDLLQRFLFSGDAVKTYAAGAEPNTDDRPRIEFSAPRSIYSGSGEANLMDIAESVRGQRFALPLKDLVSLSGTQLNATSFGLTITGQFDTPFENIQAGWWIWREIIKQDMSSFLGVADERELSWTEGSSATSLGLLWHGAPLDRETRSNTMLRMLNGAALTGGSLDRVTDADATWLARIEAETGRVEFALLWTCPQPDGGVNRYLVLRQQSDPGEENWPDSVAALSARFQCL